MKRPLKITRKKWVRWFAFIAMLPLALGVYVFTQLNFPFSTHTNLAHLQAKMGLHVGGEKADVEIIGHRGSGLENTKNHLKPIGNTENAISGGINAKVDWIEIDLRQSSNGDLILFHDETIRAKTTADQGRVSELSVVELLSFDISVEPGEKILTLEKFKTTFVDRLKKTEIGLILDIKVSGIKAPVLKWLAASGLNPNHVIIFGEYEILKDYQGNSYRLGYTLKWKKTTNRLLYLFRKKEIIKRLRDVDAEFLVVPVTFTSKVLVEMAENEGVTTWTYGSDDQRDWGKVRALGVRGVIVDNPVDAVYYLDPSRLARSFSNK